MSKRFDNVTSYGQITTAKDTVKGIRRRLRKVDADLVVDLNERLAAIESALYHVREIASLLATARTMQGRD